MMEKLKDIQDQLQKLNTQALRTIAENLSAIQQNPDINLISNSPRIYIISLSQLDARWGVEPSYYDFERQRDMLIAGIKNKQTLQEGITFLKRTVEERKVSYQGNVCFLHPVIIARVQEILDNVD